MTASLHTFVSARLAPDVARFVTRLTQTNDVHHVAVMPDVHLAGRACVGTVAATSHTLYPELLGSDLGCGVSSIPLGASRQALADPERAHAVLDALARAVPILRASDSPHAPPPSSELARLFDKEGRAELGTLGRGNHFVEVRDDEDGALHLLVHSGSRAMGPAIQAHHTRRASARSRGLIAIDASSAEGLAYLADLAWALDFARVNRETIAQRACEAIGELIAIAPDPSHAIDCQHDSVLCEVHHGVSCWVHRKGAIALPEGAPGVVPGSMGADTVIVRGRGDPRALSSSAHGAGRAVPRGVARRTIDVRTLARELDGVVCDRHALAKLVDEAPSAYKDLRSVLRAQRDLVTVVATLRPFIVHKGT